jgi:hypothetical protein
MHRTNGPAVEFKNGDKFWYENDQKHRTDGPAAELANGDKYWYIEGEHLTFDEWLKTTPLSDDHKMMIKLKYA